MPGVSRIGVDSAGGVLVANQSPSMCTINGAEIALAGAIVSSHGSGSHGHATMAPVTANVFINGVRVCVAGDLATCGHAVTGDPGVNIT